jgi:small-conductance mechanosensitive channel
MIAYAATTSANNIPENTASQLASLIELIITRIPLWIAAFIVIVLAIFLAKIMKSVVENKMAEKGIEDEHKEVQILGGRIAYITVLTIGMTVGLKIAGIDLTTIIAAVGFGVGFALKDLIMNFIAGVMIIVGRHFTIGDFIKVNGMLGRVIEIQSRVTIMRAIDGTKVIVPNADLFGNTVTSYTSNPFRRIEVDVYVDYRGDLEKAIKVFMHTVKHTKGVLAEPKPAILVKGLGDSNYDLKVRAWVESKSAWLAIKSNLIKNIRKAYDEHNIPMAWNVTQLVYDKDFPIGDITLPEDEKEKKLEEAIVAANKETPKQPKVQVTSSTSIGASQEVKPEEQPLKPLGEVR